MVLMCADCLAIEHRYWHVFFYLGYNYDTYLIIPFNSHMHIYQRILLWIFPGSTTQREKKKIPSSNTFKLHILLFLFFLFYYYNGWTMLMTKTNISSWISYMQKNIVFYFSIGTFGISMLKNNVDEI